VLRLRFAKMASGSREYKKRSIIHEYFTRNSAKTTIEIDIEIELYDTKIIEIEFIFVYRNITSSVTVRLTEP
jgi:hypothetical protein